MALESELDRLRDRANRFPELHERVKKATYSWPFLVELEYCTERIAQVFGKEIAGRLDLYDKGGQIDPLSVAGPVHALERALDGLLTVIGQLTQQLEGIPGELIQFIAWCFDRIGRKGAPFAIAIDDKVAMLTLREIAEQNAIEVLFPEFFKVFEDQRVGQFVVLLLPEHTLRRENSLNWSVIAHEVGHSYLEQSRLVSDRFPDLPTTWRELRAQANKESDTGREARQFLQLTEYACDEIAVRLTGCAFAWTLLTDFFSLEQMSSTTTHPEMHRRVRRAAELSASLGFAGQADQIVAALERQTSVADVPPTEPGVSNEDLLSVSEAIQEAIPAVTARALQEICRNHKPPLAPGAAAAELRAGRPIALDPWAVLCLATPDAAIHNSDQLQEVLADSMRLGQMQSTFLAVTRPDAAASRPHA